MPNYSDKLRLTLQIAGENDATWGDVANTVFDLLEDAIAGTASFSVTAGDVTLTTTNGATDQARCMMLDITGAPGAARSVNVPASSKVYLVNNRTTGGQTITVKTAAGTGVAVVANAPTWLYCDGTNVLGVNQTASDSLSLGGYLAALYPRLAISNLFTAAQNVQRVTLTPGATVTINAGNSNAFQLTAGQDFTLANPTGSPVDGQTIRCVIKQGIGGPWDITFGSQWAFQGGVQPNLTQTVGAIDYLAGEWYSADSIWLSAMSKDVKV